MTTENKIFALFATLAFGWLLYLLAPVLTPFIAAALLAYVGDPLADRLEKLKMRRTFAVIVVFLITFGILGALVLLVLPLVKAQGGALLDALPRYIAFAEEKILPLIEGIANTETGDSELGMAAFIERYGTMAGTWGTKILSSLGSTGGVLLTALISLFLIPMLTFYLLRDWDTIIARLGVLVPRKYQDTTFALVREADDVLGAFLRGQLLVMFGLATIYTVGLGAIGLDFALAIGAIAGLVSFVPYLGFFFGIVLAGLTALNEPNAIIMLVGVLAVFVIGQMVEGSILTPKLVGDRIGLHPVLVIFAVMAFGQLFGFFGILLALPAAAVLSVLVRFAYRRYLYIPEDELPGEDESADSDIERFPEQ